MKNLLLCTSFLLFIFSTNLAAQRLAGGEIYYELVGANHYKVTAHIYRECESDPLNSLSGFVAADTMRQNINFTRTAIKRINDTCGNPCHKVNDWGNPGFEKHTFVAFVDFNHISYSKFVTAGKCFVHFAVRQGGRDNRTTTHGTGNFYLDAGVNICDTAVKKNKSPIFSMEPKFLMALNQPLTYSPGPLDSADYDSLAFSLEPVQSDYNKNITYNQGYSADIPITPYCPPNPSVTNCRALPNSNPPRGFYFDPALCHIVVTPTNGNEMGYMRFKIREYRRIGQQWVQLGFTCREMLVTPMISPDNNPVRVSNSPSGSVFTFCSEGMTLNFQTTDEPFLPKQTTVDTTHFTWDEGYPNFDLTIYDTVREKSASLTLKHDPKTIGKWTYFTIQVYDQACNLAINSRTFVIKNDPLLEYNKTYSIDSCNVFNYDVKSKDNLTTLQSFANVYTKENILVGTTNNGVNLTINTEGIHYVKYRIFAPGNKCFTEVSDTILIQNAFPKAELNITKDTQVCASYVANLKFNPYIIPGLSSINWYKNDTLINTGDSALQTQIHALSSIKVLLSNTQNCQSEKLIRFFNIKKTTVGLLSDTLNTLCLNTQAEYSAFVSSIQKQPVLYRWRFNGIDSISYSNKFSFTVKDKGKLYLRSTDDNHCIVDDSLSIQNYPAMSMKLLNDRVKVCKDSAASASLDSLSFAPFRIQWCIPGTDTLKSFSLSYTPIVQQPSFIKVKATDFNLCELSDSFYITPINNPQVSLTGRDKICRGDSIILTALISNSTINNSIQWYVNGNPLSNTDSFIVYKGNAKTRYKIRAGNEGTCFAEAEKELDTHPLTSKIKFTTDTFYNPYHKIVLSADTGYSSYAWFNGNNTGSTEFWAYQLGSPGKYTVWCRVTDKNGCMRTDSFDIYTDRKLGLDLTADPGFRIYPNPVNAVLHIETNTESAFVLSGSDGKLLLSGTLTEGMNTFPLEQLPAGVYILKCGIHNYKIIKQ